ncbi:hypothetical protein EUX98_g7336 [Antrodiella citrinella]|uniref:Uncharacterized protein n=1 Tax=Antrodiella citrinella TaxID=2447956 RepID=A0A4S4MU56_9APHY|nr:hypothetical protein EUX98_g7336 [Antrodiella citrinella]
MVDSQWYAVKFNAKQHLFRQARRHEDVARTPIPFMRSWIPSACPVLLYLLVKALFGLLSVLPLLFVFIVVCTSFVAPPQLTSTAIQCSARTVTAVVPEFSC